MTPEQPTPSGLPVTPRAPGDASSIFYNAQEIRSGWRLLIFIAMAAAMMAVEVWIFKHVHLGKEDFAVSLFVNEIGAFLMLAAAAWVMSRMEGRTFGAYGLPGRLVLGALFWEGAAWGFAALSALLAMMHLTGNFFLGPAGLHGMLLVKTALAFAAAFLAVGLFEEFLLRGYLFFTLSTGIGFWPAAVALSIVFAALHLGNQGESKLGIFAVFVVGMVFSLMVRRTGSLWFAVGFHAAWDWAQTFFYGVPDSGLLPPRHLFSPTFMGSHWITGMPTGPEASVFVFVVLGLLALLVHLRFPAVRYEPQRVPPGAGALLAVRVRRAQVTSADPDATSQP